MTEKAQIAAIIGATLIVLSFVGCHLEERAEIAAARKECVAAGKDWLFENGEYFCKRTQ